MTTPTREQILAASAGWVAVLLNVVPGLGSGYLYQRRWRAYWITSALAMAWFVAGALLGQNADIALESQHQLVGLGVCCSWPALQRWRLVWLLKLPASRADE